MERVLIFDTTLRDGEQSPGATMSAPVRLRIATMLAALGVDVIEAGFPAASPAVSGSVAQIARDVPNVAIAALARSTRADVDAAWEALREASAPRIHVFLATSDVHLTNKLGITRADALERIRDTVAYARTKCPDVEFSAEDASRTEPAFLAQAFTAALAAGASTLNAPDTVGYSTPDDVARMIAHLREHVPEIERARLSVHTHDDLGMATANALAGVAAGARQIECTINGIGERAGNCALEEIALALRVRRDAYPFSTGIVTERLGEISRTVARATRMPVQKNKAIVGAHAFAHESGIHQDGVLKDHRTYEILDPASVGAQRRLPLSRNSGRHALFRRLGELGVTLDEGSRAHYARLFADFVAERRDASDEDLIAIAAIVREDHRAAIAV